jgi:hypothetical protein
MSVSALALTSALRGERRQKALLRYHAPRQNLLARDLLSDLVLVRADI